MAFDLHACDEYGTVHAWREVRLIERGRVWLRGPRANEVDGWSTRW